MAIVTRKFRENFEAWAARKMASGGWTAEEMASFRDLLRRDLEPGPDQLRQGLTVLIDGEEVVAVINDPDERHRLWAGFFEAEQSGGLIFSGEDQ